ncbi:PREDICTED: F-box [Prunus dulcis]|uniref:PREDICTED: F-box n=1 Tax=Prunus dulcis TaxID=3755 RepID=A0A5E4EG66_PRUDU|nr:PREDICTED: F-box [Prunus dulcis]
MGKSSSTLVFFVLDKMLEPIDHVHFAAVCKEWRALAKDYNHATQRWRQLLPMLMIPTRSQEIKRRIYSVAEGKMYNIELPVPYNDKRCCGSCRSHVCLVVLYSENFLPKGRPTACVRRILTRYKEKYEELHTVSFMVFKLVLNEDDGSVMQHIQLKNIEDEALFVGTKSFGLCIVFKLS